jgi:hypothetical protein
MFKYKFLNVIDSLSDYEFKNFGKFVSSPYFNESRYLSDMYGVVKRYYLTHTLDKLTPEIIYETVYKDGKYNNIKARKLVSDFTLLAESFLAHNALSNNILQKNDLLTDEYLKRNLDRYSEYEIGILKNMLFDNAPEMKTYLNAKQRLSEKDFATKKDITEKKIRIEKLKEIFDYNNKLSLFEKIYIYHLLIQNNIQDDEELVENGFESLTVFVDKTARTFLTNEPEERGIKLYFLILQLIAEKDILNIYNKTEEYLKENREFIKPADIEFIEYTIINSLINEINRGRFTNISLLLDVFKKIELKGYFDNLVEINHITFVEIVHFSILLDEKAFAEAFIWKYFPKINPFYKVDSLNLAIAVLRYGQKRYGEVRHQLNRVKLKSYGFYLIANSLLLRMHYEENSLNYIYPLADAFKHYLKRNKLIPEYFRQSFGLFISYLIKLTGIKSGRKKDILVIEQKISTENNFYGKEWLLNELNLLNIELSKKIPENFPGFFSF